MCEIDPKCFDTSFITEHKDATNNYTQGKFICVSFLFF